MMLFIDYDLNQPPFCWMERHEAYELIRIDVVRIQRMFKLGRAVVKRTDGGYHVKFPFRDLSPEEIISILCQTLVDRGYLYWTVGDNGRQCVRRHEKVVVYEDRGRVVKSKVEGDEPQLWEVIG